MAFIGTSPQYDTGLGFRLKTTTDVQGRLVALLTQVNLFLELGSINTESMINFYDAEGVQQSLSVENLKIMLAGYGAFCASQEGL